MKGMILQLCLNLCIYIIKILYNQLFCFMPILITTFSIRYMIFEFCIFQCIQILSGRIDI